jgi:hypothetical protein
MSGHFRHDRRSVRTVLNRWRWSPSPATMSRFLRHQPGRDWESGALAVVSVGALVSRHGGSRTNVVPGGPGGGVAANIDGGVAFVSWDVVCWAATPAASDTMAHEARRAFNEFRIIFLFDLRTMDSRSALRSLK